VLLKERGNAAGGTVIVFWTTALRTFSHPSDIRRMAKLRVLLKEPLRNHHRVDLGLDRGAVKAIY
jgi:hypothetical protein